MKACIVYSLVLLAVFLYSCNGQPSENHQVKTPIKPKTAQLLPNEPVAEKSATISNPEPEIAARKKPKAKTPKGTQKTPLPTKIKETSTSLAAAPAPFTEPEPEKALTVADIYKHFEKTPQTFTLPLNKDTTLICREGTSLKIPANAFISEKTGQEITGPIQLSVKEYYQLSDMLLANLSTKSGNNMLGTGGMLHLTATSASNENLVLKPDQKIEIGFPYETPKPDMQLFLGDWKEEQMVWQLAENETVNAAPRDTIEIGILTNDEVYVTVEEMPVFPGGEEALMKYLQANVKRPFSLLPNNINGVIYATFTITEAGNITDVTIIRGINRLADKSAVYAINKMPNWKPGRKNNKDIPVTMTIPIAINFEAFTDTTNTLIGQNLIKKAKAFEDELKNVTVVYGRNSLNTDDKNFKKAFESNTTDSTLNQTSVSEVNRYLLSTSNLGWVNCDRFYNSTKPKIDFAINTKGNTDLVVTTIFHSIKAIIPGQPIKNNYIVSGVPAGEKVTIVAFKTENNQIKLAVKETTIKKSGEKDLIFEPVTMAKLKEEMTKLNSISR